MKIAIEGCAHGELEKIYETIEKIESQQNVKIDLLICCGDFQATRNLNDLQTMAVPKKYQDICTFYKYYSGEKVAPILTIFIGGNHEASNYLQELPYGGWVAPKIYYMGLAGVVKINGIRIAGISGIYKGHDFLRGHHEFSPYTDETKRSVYHVRQLEVFRLKQLSGNVDICLSHDWPRGVYNYGNHNQLIKFKPHFKDEIDNDKLGSPPCADILNTLQPTYWFAAHLHCKFAALIPHDNTEKITKFLALDKCLPKRRFLQVIDYEADENELINLSNQELCGLNGIFLEYDLEWLSILHTTNHLISVKNSPSYMPGPNGNNRYDFTPTDEEKEFISKRLNGDFRIPNNFCKTVEPYNPNEQLNESSKQPKSQINPQTTQFCDLLSIDDPLSLAMIITGHELSHSTTLDESINSELLNTSSFILESDQSFSSNCDISPLKRKSMVLNLPKPKENDEPTNPNEIFLSDSEAEERSSDFLNSLNSSKNLTAETTLDISDASDLEKDIELKTKLDNSFETKEIIVEKTSEEMKPAVKKFKRRNQNLYTTVDEED